MKNCPKPQQQKKQQNDKVPTIGKIVSVYNKLETASITWSRSERRFKLYDKILTPVTAEWINELFILNKENNNHGVSITAKELKNMLDIMREFDDLVHNLDDNLDEESRKYFDLPWVDEPINDEVVQDFNEEYDEEEN